MPKPSRTKMYSAMLEIFQNAGYKQVASVEVDDKTHQATAFMNPSNNQLYIVYHPFEEEDNEFDIALGCDHVLATKMDMQPLKVNQAKKVALTIYKNNLCNLSEINSTSQIKDVPQQRPENVIEDIRQFANKELGFFARHPWIKDVAIGVGIGLAIVGGVAAVVLTAGAALIPSILGFGAAVGFGTGGIAAIVATTFVAGCAAIAVGWGKVFDGKKSQTSIKPKVSANKPQEKVKENISNKSSSSSYAHILSNNAAIEENISNADKINAVVAFIKANIKFFMAPIENPDVFSIWSIKSKEAMDITHKIQASLIALIVEAESGKKRKDYSMAYEFRDTLFGNGSLGPLSVAKNSTYVNTDQHIQETMPVKGLIDGNEEPLRNLLNANSELVEAILSISNSPREKLAIERFSASVVTYGAEADYLRNQRLAKNRQFEDEKERVSKINNLRDAEARERHQRQQREAANKKRAANSSDAVNDKSVFSMRKSN